MAQTQFLSADQATVELGISKGTLYSYVSRGLIRSVETEGTSRQRQYLAEDVQELKIRKERRVNPARSAATALDFGDPVMESSLTLISDGRLFYRGHDVLKMADERTFEEVVALLWVDSFAATHII